MAHLDRESEKPSQSFIIERVWAFQEEWLEGSIRWISKIHPMTNSRWSVEAGLRCFFSVPPLRSAYRVIARDGRVVWFQSAKPKMIRKKSGRPWFIHGIGFDITELKQVEEELASRNVIGSPQFFTRLDHWWWFSIRRAASSASTSLLSR